MTSNMKNIRRVFKERIRLTSLNFLHFDFSKIDETDYMFSWCGSLTGLALDFSSFDARLVATSESVFEGMPREQEYENYFRSEYDKEINESMNNKK